MSDKFIELQDKYNKQHITIATLKGWVVLNTKRPGKGITTDEYQLITGEEYTA